MDQEEPSVEKATKSDEIAAAQRRERYRNALFTEEYLKANSKTIAMLYDNCRRSVSSQQQDGMPQEKYTPKVYSVKEQNKPLKYQVPNIKLPGRQLSLPVAKDKFPRMSQFDAQQHALYYKFFTMNNEEIQALSDEQLPELDAFQEMQDTVYKEQREFVAYAGKFAAEINYENMPVEGRRYIEKNLQYRQLTEPRRVPKRYHHMLTIPMGVNSGHNLVDLEPIQELLTIGTVPKYEKTPFGIDPLWLPAADVQMLKKKYPVRDSKLQGSEKFKSSGFIHHTPMSKDANARYLGQQHGANVLIAASSVKLLIDCHRKHLQNRAFPSNLPITVTTYIDQYGKHHNQVIIDKALPPITMSAYEKKIWLCRRALRVLFCHDHQTVYSFNDGAVQTKESAVSFEEDMRAFQEKWRKKVLEGAEEEKKEEPPFDLRKSLEQLFPGLFPSTSVEADPQEYLSVSNNDLGFTPAAPGDNYTYGLWKLGKQVVEGDKKDVLWKSSDIKLIIRTSCHGFELNEEGTTPVMVYTSVKLEHQPTLGAQTTTVREAARDWMSMLLIPNCTLYRSRVDAESLQVIQTEKLNLVDLAKETKRRNFNAEEAMGSLYFILQNLMRLKPGKYLMQLKPREEIVTILQENKSDTKRRGGISFYHILNDYKSHARSETGPCSCVAYSPIDKLLTTPLHKNRIPATYLPAPPVCERVAKEQTLFKLMDAVKARKRGAGTSEPLAEQPCAKRPEVEQACADQLDAEQVKARSFSPTQANLNLKCLESMEDANSDQDGLQ